MQLQQLTARLFKPVDGASLAVFRILFASLLVWEVSRYFGHHWIETKFLFPKFHFTYHGFEWVKPLPPEGLFWVFRALGICAFLMLVGLFYRVAAAGVFVLFSYIFLLDKAEYLNHFYFTILLAFLMMLAPANRVWSLDRLFGRTPDHDMVPAWSLWAGRAQMEIMLIWAGLVKLNADWLTGRPLGDWLAGEAHRFPDLMGYLMRHPDVAISASWGVAILHIAGAPLLFVPRVRVAVFVMYCSFHLLNHHFWNIGIFPWLTIAGTLLFFEADWPRKVARVLRLPAPAPTAASVPFAVKPVFASVLALFIVFQALLPLRPYVVYAGNPAWNEQGHRFSWRMKLRDKEGRIRFFVVDPASGRRWAVDLKDFLTARQARAMSIRPSMILEFAHFLRDHWREGYGVEGVRVYADSFVSLNGRPFQRYIDPRVDLASEPRTFFKPDRFILPFRDVGEVDA